MEVRILIVDDEKPWRDNLPDLLRSRLDPNLTIDVVETYSQALVKVKVNRYDLVSVDFELIGNDGHSMEPGLEGMELLGECRKSSRNQACGLLVLSGRATPEAVYRALERYEINYFLDKHDFGDGTPYIRAAQVAMRGARIQRAERAQNSSYQLRLTFEEGGSVRAELAGPNHRSEAHVSGASLGRLDDLARRADDLNQRFSAREIGAWRPEAKSIGSAVYETIFKEPQIQRILATGRAFAANHGAGHLALQFSGPPSYLSVPFELIRDEDDYLALSLRLTRRLTAGGPRFTSKAYPFHTFLKKLVSDGEPLRILIAGACVGGGIPSVEREVSRLIESIDNDLKILGIGSKITVLLGNDISYAELSESLREGQHIFHFAGHGNFNEALAEKSPLLLRDKELTASDLELLVRDTELQFVFLSCCFGAQTGRQVGRGDFQGFLHALTRADVPNILGYRWRVKDQPATRLATDFYSFLWQDLSFSGALLNCRRQASMRKEGRDDETWAAPVLLMQGN